jgi:hypothetical protein
MVLSTGLYVESTFAGLLSQVPFVPGQKKLSSVPSSSTSSCEISSPRPRGVTAKLSRTAANGYRLLQFLYERPIVSVKDVQELIDTEYPAANDLVSRFEELGILVEITGQARNRKFKYDDYIALFNEADS